MKRFNPASLLIALIALFPLPLSAAAAAAAAPIESATSNSHNWSGYVAESSGLSAISADWVVPAATSTANAGDATWIGIGGMTTSDLIQTGTRGLVRAGAVSYEAWYEILPAAGTPIGMQVSAGNLMRASIVETAPDTWTISLDDLSSGASFSKTLPYHSSGNSAEWIEEAPQSAGAVMPLDDFSPVVFSSASAERAGTSETPAALSATRVSLVDQSLAPLATPSELAASGDAFTILRD